MAGSRRHRNVALGVRRPPRAARFSDLRLRRNHRTRNEPLAGDRSSAAPPNSIAGEEDRKSTRLNSSHVAISYAVFCLKKKSNARSTGRQLHSLPNAEIRSQRPFGKRAEQPVS